MRRRRYHFGLPGVLYVLVTLLLAIGAANGQNNLLFLAFSIAIGAGVASGLLSGAMMMGLSVERLLPDSASAGAPMTIRYRVRSRHRFLPVFAVRVEEATARSVRRRDRRTRATWQNFITPPAAAVMHLAPGETIEVSATVTPRRRGEATFAGVVLVTAFPFGLIRKSVLSRARATLLIAPRVERLRRDAASNLLARAEAGLASSPVLGRGDEFYGVRDYVPGDSPKLIAWRSSARTGGLVVRENTAPTSGRVWILLNLNAPRPSTRAPHAEEEDDATEQGISLAASLCDAASAANVDVGFAAPEHGVAVAPGSAPRQRQAIMCALARLDPSREAAPNAAPMDRFGRRAACVVVHTGGIDPSFGPSGARHVSGADLARLAAPPRRDADAREGPA